MRILLCCQQDLRPHPLPAYRFWAEYFRSALAEAGHTCLEAEGCDWAEGLLALEPDAAAAWRERTWTSTVNWLRREHARQPVDLFLSYLFPKQVLSAALDEIRALGIPCVNFFCDNVREFRRVPAEFRDFDLHWVPEYKAISLYEKAKLPFLHAPMPCWVPQAQRTSVERETLPVTFIGTRDQERERLFADAITLGLVVDLRGPGWESDATTPVALPLRARNPLELARRQFDFARQHGWTALARKHARSLGVTRSFAFDFAPYAKPPQFGDAYWTVLRGCSVCLGVNRYPSLRFPTDRPDTYSRLRDIEAPMAGACYLTEWTEGLDRLFDLGIEIETYRDAAELAAKVELLSHDPARRRRLRAAAQRRALSDHSIARTLTRVAERLDLRG